MSQLEEFQRSESWRNNLKKFLLTERDPKNIVREVDHLNRYEMDDKTMFKKKKSFQIAPQIGSVMSDNEDKENQLTNKYQSVETSVLKPKQFQVNNTFFQDFELLSLQNCSIARFEAIEKICDKTNYNSSFCLSDDQKANVLKNEENESIPETTKLHNLLYKEDILFKNSLKNDVTQLDDIEPPSKFWENSMVQTSPVKMIGLNRPSTIIEEQSGSAERSSNISSQNSFVTANTRPSFSNTAYFSSNNSTTSISNDKISQPNRIKQETEIIINENFESDCSIIQISDDESIELTDYFDELDPSLKIVSNLTKESDEIKHNEIDTKWQSTAKIDDGLSLDFNNDSGMFETLEKEVSSSVSPARDPTVIYPKNRAALDIKPIPKLDIFKKPNAILQTHKSRRDQRDNFVHVKSPIGTYIKKTGTTPFMTTIKTKTGSIDALEVLERENNLYKQKPKSVPEFDQLPGVPKFSRTLPKKGYISSEFQHYIDRRKPITIPGGSKIQKYIENARLPTVLRHDGKIKLGGNSQHLSELDNLKSINNASLVNLSVASGDISVYTIKDAQKF